MTWVCPDCQRVFRRKGQGHECAPAMSIEGYFSTGPPFERPVFDAVMDQLSDVGPIHIEPLSVGIYLKRSQTFATLRPMTKWVALGFGLDRRLSSSRISRKVEPYGQRYFHVVNVPEASEVDDEIGEWLTEAYDLCPD